MSDEKKLGFQEVFVEGTLTKKKFNAPSESHVCGNCCTEYKGYYCPNCGQKYNVERLSFASIFNHAIEGITGFTPNLPRTLIDLFYRPGYLVRDYILQKRRDYSNPFSTVLILAAAFMLCTRYVYHTDLTQASMAYGDALYSTAMSERLVADSEGIVSQQVAEQQQLTIEMMDIIYDNYGIFLLGTLIIMVFPMWLAFRSKKGGWLQLNLCECATASAFYTCLTLEISILAGWLMNSSDGFILYSIVSYGVSIPLLVVMLCQLYQMPVGQFIWRFILYLFLCFFSFLVFGATVGVGFMIYTMANGQI